MAKIPLTLRDQVDRTLGKYVELDQVADDLIDSYIAEQREKIPTVPTGVIRQCQFETHAVGFSHRLALERLRRLLA
jgi:hypothetical protein